MAAFAVLLTSLWMLWVLLGWLVTAFFAGHVAGVKGGCGGCWFLWGVLFGPLALLATLGLPDRKLRQEVVRLREAVSDAAVAYPQIAERAEPMYAD